MIKSQVLPYRAAPMCLLALVLAACIDSSSKNKCASDDDCLNALVCEDHTCVAPRGGDAGDGHGDGDGDIGDGDHQPESDAGDTLDSAAPSADGGDGGQGGDGDQGDGAVATADAGPDAEVDAGDPHADLPLPWTLTQVASLTTETHPFYEPTELGKIFDIEGDHGLALANWRGYVRLYPLERNAVGVWEIGEPFANSALYFSPFSPVPQVAVGSDRAVVLDGAMPHEFSYEAGSWKYLGAQIYLSGNGGMVDLSEDRLTRMKNAASVESYRREGKGWELIETLAMPDPSQPIAEFRLFGDTAVAIGDSTYPLPYQLTIFDRQSGGTWSHVDTIAAPDAIAPGDLRGKVFGIASDGLRLAVVYGSGAGMEVWLFERSALGAKFDAGKPLLTESGAVAVALVDGSALVADTISSMVRVYEQQPNKSWAFQESKSLFHDGWSATWWSSKLLLSNADGELLVGDVNPLEYTHNDLGGVRVLRPSELGVWQLRELLTAPPDQKAGAGLGAILAVDGNRLIAAAPGMRTKLQSAVDSFGAAQIWEKDGAGTWQRAAWLAQPRLGYAYSVAIRGDVALVGLSNGSPAVYAYKRAANGTWSESDQVAETTTHAVAMTMHDGVAMLGGTSGSNVTVRRIDTQGKLSTVQTLAPEDSHQNDGFGSSLALGAKLAAIGAPGTQNQTTNRGAVYVFEKNDSGLWIQGQKLMASDGAEEHRFGATVALWDQRIVIGAPYNGKGVAYVFERSGDGSWHEIVQLTRDDDRFGFGWAVATRGNEILLGSPHGDGSGPDCGAAILFTKRDGAWTEAGRIATPTYCQDLSYGNAVALGAGTAFVGVPGENNVGVQAGAVKVYSY